LALIFTAACGSSSQTETLTAPSSNKCTLQATADSPSFPAAGGSGSLRITTNRDCQWSAKPDAGWVTIVEPADGQGDGSVRFSVQANGDPASRSAGIAVNDQRVDVSQAGKPCELTLSSNHESVGSAGGDLSINVRASAVSCAWTTNSGVPWISSISPRDGRGNGTVTFHVDSVSGPPRTGNVTIAGQNVEIEQGTGCSYTVGIDTISVDGSGGERQVPVTAPPGCSWSAQSQATWITIANGANGSGPGTVVFRISPSDGAGRAGAVIVAGRTVTVTQSPSPSPAPPPVPAPCTYSIAPSSISVGAQASSSAIQVDAGAGCAWTATSGLSWISVVNGGTGGGPVQIAIAANTGPARSGTITIAGRSLTITQANGCTYSVEPASRDVAGDGGNAVASITTAPGCTWTATSAVNWVTVATPSGAGSGQATFAVQPNASPPRSGTVALAGRTLTINQASLCRWFFAPPSHEFSADAGAGNVLVFVTGACSWTAVPNVPWIQITAGGSNTGGGLLQFTVPANPGASRTGIIALGGENYVVHQAGAGLR